MQLIRIDAERRALRTTIPDTGVGVRRGASGVELVDVADATAIARIVPHRENGAPRAALVLAPRAAGVFVNGLPPLVVSLLEELAEILIGGARIHFGAHAPPEVTAFAGDAAVRCAVCGERLAPGDLVIACGRCRAAHHEGALADPERGERRCFTYRGESCAECGLTRAECMWLPDEEDA